MATKEKIKKEAVMVDISKVFTVSQYAKKVDKTTTWVHDQIRKGTVNLILISGKKFVQVN